MKKSLVFSSLGLALASACLFSSCVTLDGFLDYTDKDGNLNVGKIAAVSEAIVTSAETISKAAEGVSPETEYAIGRSAAAILLQDYKLYENPDAVEYLNKICTTLTINSPRPYMYKGYFVAILDSDEINAISTPGGHIFISKGLLDCTNSEDAIAAIIAHELSHIQIGHSKQAIEGERGLDVAASTLSVVLAAGGSDFSSDDVASLNNSSDSFVRKVVRNGFSQGQEYEADANAIKLMSAAGYNPFALVDMLQAINLNTTHSSGGWDDTHPEPSKRIKEALGVLKRGDYRVVNMKPRQERFTNFKKNF